MRRKVSGSRVVFETVDERTVGPALVQEADPLQRRQNVIVVALQDVVSREEPGSDGSRRVQQGQYRAAENRQSVLEKVAPHQRPTGSGEVCFFGGVVDRRRCGDFRCHERTCAWFSNLMRGSIATSSMSQIRLPMIPRALSSISRNSR